MVAGKAQAVEAVAAAVAPSVMLAPAHGYVALSLVFAVLVHNFYMSFKVGAARKKFGVKYPAVYATGDSPEANQFNCTQRGHQNSLESLPSFLALLLVAGFKFPLTAAIAGVVYTVGKIVYINSYSSGDPNKRVQGAFSYFGLFTLIGCVIRFAISLLTA
eukprot:jgi/Tetstr1/455526/TSEL_042350.t1